MTDHIFTPGEQVMRDRAQQQLAAAGNLLNEPLKRQHVHEALKQARAAASALEYLETRAAGMPAPRKGD